MSRIKFATIVFSMLFFITTALASEADELREKAEAIQREAAELAEHGHKEEAAHLKRRAMAMLEEAERVQHHRHDQRKAEIMEMEKRLRMLELEEMEVKKTGGNKERLVDLRREAEVIRDKLRHVVREAHHEHGGPRGEIAHRLEHMRMAVDHLHEAGLHDIAEHVAERAEATERELHEQHRHREGDVIHEVMKQLDEIRREMGRLRDEVNELRRQR